MNSQKNNKIIVLYKHKTPGTPLQVALYSSKVAAGFPSPAEDYIDKSLDLNEHLIQHPAATFFVTVTGDSMIDAGIQHNDVLIVDRSIKPLSGHIVIAIVDGQFTVKKLLRQKSGGIFLIPANAQYQPIEISGDMECHIWGVVMHAIHSFGK
jgi:DNA polymerase V